MRILKRRQILRRARQKDDQLVAAIAGLQNIDPRHFDGDLAVVRALWNDHQRTTEQALYQPAVRLLPNGREVTVALVSQHETFRAVLDNLDVGTQALTTAGKQELAALSRELASHAGHEQRRVLRPLLRRLSRRDAQLLVESLGTKGTQKWR